jgi:hypothetical protein
MGAAASTAFAFSIVPSNLLGNDAPSNKLNVALIGVGGQGGASIRDESVQSQNIVALCDVDLGRPGPVPTPTPRWAAYRPPGGRRPRGTRRIASGCRIGLVRRLEPYCDSAPDRPPSGVLTTGAPRARRGRMERRPLAAQDHAGAACA